jgi:cytochrome oxidase Cu insertion factor (SCO1/SenC/PrrC family)
MHKTRRFALLSLILLLLSFILVACGAPPKTAVNFTLPNTQGKNTILYDFKGKPVLLAFITTW